MFDLRKVSEKLQYNNPAVILFFISLLWLLLNGVALLRYPSVTSDEALVSLVAFRQTPLGQSPNISQFDPYGAYPFRLYLVGLAQWFNLFGLGLVQGRAFSLLAAYLSSWLMFLLGREMYGTQVGLVAGTLFLYSTRVFWTSHYIRPEMWVVVANLTAFWVGWRLTKKPSVWQAAFAGFLSVAILDVYLSALSTTLIIGLLITVWSLQQRRWSLLLAYGLGFLGGATYYVAVQFLPDWPTSLRHWQQWFSVTNRIGSQASAEWMDRVVHFPATLFEHFVRYSIIGSLELVYFVGSVIGLVKRRVPQDTYLLGGAVIALVFFAFVFSTSHHAIDSAPLLILIMAVGVVGVSEFLTRLPSLRWPLWLTQTRLVTLLVAPLLLGYTAVSVYYWWAGREYDYFAYVHELKQLSDPQAVIFGEGSWWFGFTWQPYWWDETFEGFEPQTLDEARSLVETPLTTQKINTIFVDENLGIMPDPSSNKLTRQALEDYIAGHCKLRGKVQRIAYGVDFGLAVKQTRVYSCNP